MKEAPSIPKEIYQGREQSREFYINRFFNYYKGLIDKTSMKSKSDFNTWKNNLIKLDKETRNIDFSKDTMFFYEKDISKMLYLVGFGRLDSLRTYKFYTVLDIVDIYMANSRWDNPDLSDSDIRVSEQNIREEVLCLYGDKFMTHWNKSGFMLTNTFVGREKNVSKNGKKLITWFFFKGTQQDAIQNPLVVDSLRYFESMKDDGYQIIDFNNTGKDLNIETSHKSNNKQSKESKKSLKDIY